MKTRKILFYIFGVIAVAINVLIIVESFIGGNNSASQSFSISEAVADALDSFNPSGVVVSDRIAFHSAIRKIVGHFLLFGLSGLFTTATLFLNDYLYQKFRWKTLLLSLGFGLVVALVSELIQYFVPGRYGVLTDVLIDFAGYLGFTTLTYFIIYSIYKRHNIETKKPD